MVRVSVLLSNNCFSTPSVKCAAKSSNVGIDLWNSNLLHSPWVCLIQISSTQTCIKSSSIQAFSCVLTTNSLVGFSLKNDHSRKHFPICCADKTTVRCFFSLLEEQTRHSLSPFFAVYFDGTMLKNAGVSSILPTSESGYLPILMYLAASLQNFVKTSSDCLSSFWLIEVRARRASLCQAKNLVTQTRLVEKDELWGCIRFLAFSWKLKTDRKTDRKKMTQENSL